MEKLNCRTFMIGDWVIYNGKPIKVENVCEDFINYSPDIPYVQEEFYIEQDELEPIPLTEEILEKNGIKRSSYDGKIYGKYFSEDEHGRLEISVNGDDIWWSINCEEYHILKLNFVHELQHALRLCGINKEIEL